MENHDQKRCLEKNIDTAQRKPEQELLWTQAALLKRRNDRLLEQIQDLEAVIAKLTRLLFTVDGVSLPLVEPTEARCETAPLLAPIWKNTAPDGEAFYEFGLFRETTFGDAVFRFRPEEVLKLPYLLQQLASYFCGIDSLDPALRDDLSCLSCCLEDFLGIKRCPHRLNDRERKALAEVFDFLGHGKEQHHCEDPTEHHILGSLMTLKAWFDAATAKAS